MLTHERLKEFLEYNKLTGIFNHLTDSQYFSKGDYAGFNELNSCGNWYRRISIDRKIYYAHRLAIFYITGNTPDGNIDHINGHTLQNNYINLRVVTHAVNSKNRKIQKNNKTGCNGVKQVASGNYVASITVNKKKLHLGTHLYLETAITIRKAADCWFNFHNNHGRKRVTY